MFPPRPPVLELETLFGPLELRVLDALWARGAAVVVRDLQPAFPGIAYTTIMTTLDRLYRKGLLARERSGRAFAYRPRWTRDELTSNLAGTALAALMPKDPGSIRPLISMFVDEVGRRDASLLDELEQQIRRRRGEGE
jgi:predicted transcriptional regulator